MFYLGVQFVTRCLVGDVALDQMPVARRDRFSERGLRGRALVGQRGGAQLQLGQGGLKFLHVGFFSEKGCHGRSLRMATRFAKARVVESANKWGLLAGIVWCAPKKGNAGLSVTLPIPAGFAGSLNE